MLGMKAKPKYSAKIPANTIQSVKDDFEDMYSGTAKLVRGQIEGERLTREEFTNCIILHFLSLNAEERKRIVLHYLPAFRESRALLARESGEAKEEDRGPRTIGPDPGIRVSGPGPKAGPRRGRSGTGA